MKPRLYSGEASGRTQATAGTSQWAGLRKDPGHSRNHLEWGQPYQKINSQKIYWAWAPMHLALKPQMSINCIWLSSSRTLWTHKHEIVCVVTMACTVCHCSREKAAPGSLRDSKVPSWESRWYSGGLFHLQWTPLLKGDCLSLNCTIYSRLHFCSTPRIN